MIDIKLISKPISEPIRYNAYYKLVMLLAILKYCTRNSHKAPLSLIHLFLWSLRTEKNHNVLYDFAKQNRNTLIPWSFEPGVSKILSLSYVEGYCQKVIVSKKLEIKITDEGNKVLDEIDELNLFSEEIKKIKDIGFIAKSRIDRANINWKLT